MAYGLTAWRLKADPFPYSTAPLSPLDDAAQLDYYSDFYDWRDSSRAGGLDANGRIKVFQLGAGSTTTLLISGPAGCGRSSLENLLRYEIGQRAASEPLFVRLRLTVGDQDKATRGTMLVQNIQREVKRRDRDAGKVILETVSNWQTLTPPGVQPSVTNLLGQLRQDIQDELPNAPIVVSLDALDHMISLDAALDAVDMVQDFADVAILAVTVPDHASYVRSRFSSRQRPVAWINAPRVGPDIFKGYVERRVNAEREPGPAVPTAIYPLTDDAISRIFATADGMGTVTLPMRLAIQKLSRALDYKHMMMAAGAAMHAPEVNGNDVEQSFSAV